jgi:hypothetical protein
VIEAQLLRVLHSILVALARSWRSLSSGPSIFYARGRAALLRRVEARTELEELAVEQKRLELYTQRANAMLDLVLKIDKIKDPQLREKAKATISAGGQILLPQDDAAE